MNIKESAPIIKSHIRGVRYVICSWEYYTFSLEDSILCIQHEIEEDYLVEKRFCS